VVKKNDGDAWEYPGFTEEGCALIFQGGECAVVRRHTNTQK